MPPHVSSTCAHRQEVKIVLYSLWYHHTYRCDDTMMMVNVKINILRCTVSKISKHYQYLSTVTLFYSTLIQ